MLMLFLLCAAIFLLLWFAFMIQRLVEAFAEILEDDADDSTENRYRDE